MNKLVEGHAQVIAESIRWSTYFGMNVHLARKDKVTKPEKLWGLPWDKDRVQKFRTQTKQQMWNVMKSIFAANPKKHKKKG